MRADLALASLGLACGASSPSNGVTGVLEIGVCEVDGQFEWGSAERCLKAGTFRKLNDGDTAVVVTGSNALNMIVPSLRASNVDPRAPDPTVTVTIEGQPMAAAIAGTPADMQAEGDGFVLWNLRVPFTSELCCYTCREVLIEAILVDTLGHRFEGSVRPVTQFRSCPNVCDCCVTAKECPSPALTQVCPGGKYPEECLPPLPPDAGDGSDNGDACSDAGCD